MPRKIIPYNPKRKDFAKKLRHNMTFSERVLWKAIKNGQVMGYDFDRQRMIGNYIVDFYCKDLQLALEVDGITHLNDEARKKDSIRQNELEIAGVRFLRFDALLVINKVEAIIKEIENWILKHEEVNGVSEYAMRKRLALLNPRSRKR